MICWRKTALAALTFPSTRLQSARRSSFPNRRSCCSPRSC